MSVVGADRESAEDVLQQVYLLIVEGRAHFDGRSSLKTWLYGVIRKVGGRHNRRRYLERLRHTGQTQDQVTACSTETPDLQDQQTRQAIAQAIAVLPKRQREVLELTVFREFTLEQCATILGVRLGSVRTHYHRGKSKLRLILENEFD